MEKEQLDSLATVTVGSEKIPPPDSHYAPSEVYSASESPPAYTRPKMKSNAVQIARIIAGTMIAISIIIGSFILASGWLQARASCTPESIAAMHAQLHLQQSHNEMIKHLKPEALVQDRDVIKTNSQSLTDSASSEKDQDHADTKDLKDQSSDEDSKSDNDNGDQTDADDDYDDAEFPPVRIKLPLKLDLDDLAGSLLQQARSVVSCVVERRRSDELEDGTNDNALTNSTGRQGLNGESVAILCQSAGDQRPEQQEQEMLAPIVVPLGTVQIPLQAQEVNRYQIHNQYQVPETQRVPMPSDPRGMISPFSVGLMPPQLRNLPQVSMEMGPPPRMPPQPNMMGPIEVRQIPNDFRQIPMDLMRGMKPSAEQQHQQQPQNPMMFNGPKVQPMMYHHEQTQDMMPPPPPPTQQETPAENPNFLFQGIPVEIRRIIQQVPTEIRNIIEHITGDTRSAQTSVPVGARRVHVQEFKSFPEDLRAIPVGPFPLPNVLRNFFAHGNNEGRVQDRDQDSEEQQGQHIKPSSGSEDQSEDQDEINFPIPAEILNLRHQVVAGRAILAPQFAGSLRAVESMEVPVGAQTQVSDNQTPEEHHQQHVDEHHQQHQQQQQQQQQHQPQPRLIIDAEEPQDVSNRVHEIHPRSVRSIPEAFAHPRDKRVRRCACDCNC